jgi:hypothetical protein
MTSSTPPPIHRFLDHADGQASVVVVGIAALDRQHLPALARALPDVLEKLDNGQPSTAPIQFKTVKKVFQAPPWSFSDTAIRDLSKLLRQFARTYSKLDLPRCAGNLRIYQPIMISNDWTAHGVGSPHVYFRRSTIEEKEVALAKELEHQAFVSMFNRRRRRRWHMGGIPATTPKPQKPPSRTVRAAMKAALDAAIAAEEQETSNQ